MPQRNGKMTRLLFMTIYGFAHVCSTNLAKAQQKDPLPVEEGLRVRSFEGFGWSSMDLSPDGNLLAYVVRDNEQVTTSSDPQATTRTGIPFGTIAGHCIYLSDIKTGKLVTLTGEDTESWLPVWSPDGRYLAFLSNRDGSGQAKLWIWSPTKSEFTKVTDKPMRTEEIIWLADSRRLLVTAQPSGSFVPNSVRAVESKANSQNATPGRQQQSTVVVYESDTSDHHAKASSNAGPWNLDDTYLHDLFLVDVTTGESRTIVKGQKVARYRASPDGSHIAFTVPKRFETGSQQILFDLVVVSIETSNQQTIASDIRLDFDGGEFSWAPDSAAIVYHAGGPATKIRDCFVVSALGGDQRNITKLSAPRQMSEGRSSIPLWDAKRNIYFVEDGVLWRTSIDSNAAAKLAEIKNRDIVELVDRADNKLWTFDGEKHAVAITHDDAGKQDGFYQIDVESGQTEKLREMGQCYRCGNSQTQFRVAMDGQHIVYLSEDAQHSPDVWLTDYRFADPQRLTRMHPQFDQVEMGSARLIDWLSDDGKQLHGALLLPSSYQAGQRYPLLVWVYGSLSLSDFFDRFGLFYGGTFNMQFFATRGYAVLLPDSPLSEGSAMADLAKTVLPGVNKVIEMGIADPERLGVMGQSNGGFSTLALIVQSKRFKAAIAIDGMGDLVSLYSEMDKGGATYGLGLVEHGQDSMGGTPWQYRDRYIENSPFFYLDRVETPLLIVHGSEDSYVAPFLGDQIFVGLRRLGKEVVYAKYLGEGHTPREWTFANQVDLCNRMIDWFDKYLNRSKH